MKNISKKICVLCSFVVSCCATKPKILSSTTEKNVRDSHGFVPRILKKVKEKKINIFLTKLILHDNILKTQTVLLKIHFVPHSLNQKCCAKWINVLPHIRLLHVEHGRVCGNSNNNNNKNNYNNTPNNNTINMFFMLFSLFFV